MWIDDKVAEMQQGDTGLSGRMDRSKTRMDGRAATERESPPHFFTKHPQLFSPRFLARGLA